ncbi:hypothetical protein CCR75_006653 [Bremia lactucae]|uniref:Adenylate kinase active site lid domain-containing protein n=1 Tax=Bremia lactucae TaxID=4779 RepID=A0A976FDC4_BRELC|nr:hypothetical protein CCR75_006653 [Bremia lactucae]
MLPIYPATGSDPFATRNMKFALISKEVRTRIIFDSMMTCKELWELQSRKEHDCNSTLSNRVEILHARLEWISGFRLKYNLLHIHVIPVLVTAFCWRLTTNMTSKSLKIMFLGAPGAGKGTYASRIAPMLQIPTISTGDLVRFEIKNGTQLGARIKSYNNSGALVPDQIILDMMETRLAQVDAKRGFILDGFPRNVPQAKAFQNVTDLDLVVNINLPQWILTDKISGRRVCTKCGSGYNVAYINKGAYQMPPLLPKTEGVCDSCGAAALVQRPDDTPETVKQRLEVYNRETAPLIDFYTQLGNLRTFDVKKGLADLDQLVGLIEKELHP